jgi:aldehyde:ferredoxin oxidoreductase
VIGPAGEHLVLFAGIVSNQRIAARTGVGAVMGAKRLKAVTAGGSRKLEMDERGVLEYTNGGRHVSPPPVLRERLRVGTGTSARRTWNILPTQLP